MKNETLRLMIKLCVICIIVAGVLAYVNSLTAPVIKANEQKLFNESMTEVLPSAVDFNEVKDFEASDVDGVYAESVYKSDNGYVVTTVCQEGYGGDIKVMVGIKDDLTVERVKIMAMSETAGLGAKASGEDFWGQYSGLKADIGVKKNNGGNSSDNTISAISGATVTSKAVTKAVNYALTVANECAGGGTNE